MAACGTDEQNGNCDGAAPSPAPAPVPSPTPTTSIAMIVINLIFVVFYSILLIFAKLVYI